MSMVRDADFVDIMKGLVSLEILSDLTGQTLKFERAICGPRTRPIFGNDESQRPTGWQYDAGGRTHGPGLDVWASR